MMHIVIILLFFSLGFRDVQSKVDIKKGRIERVVFDGDKLVIVVDNSAGKAGKIQICFASSPDASYPPCPSGFASTTVTIGGYTKRELTLNRQGRLFLGREPFGIMGTVKFNEDGTFNITVAQLPNAWTILFLQNAEIFVPEKPKEDKVVTKKKSNASVKVVAVVVVLILMGVIISILVWSCVVRKPESKRVAECDDRDDSPELRVRSSTPRNLLAPIPVKQASHTTVPTTIKTAVSPRHTAYPNHGINAHSPSGMRIRVRDADRKTRGSSSERFS